MAFTFLHTADWQIGRPFRAFPTNVAGRLEEARLQAIDRLAQCARDAGAKHVLVGGDVYDASSLPAKERRQPMERMQRNDDITWALLPGNHDPARAGGIWACVARDGLPKNVQALIEPTPFELAPSVHVLPAPLTAKAMTSDPTAWMDNAPTPEGHTRFGLAHGSVRGFGSQGESSIGIDPDRAKRAGLAYLALGDWHGMSKVNARTWYSGTPEPDRFRQNQPGFALIVHLNDAQADPQVTPVPVARYHWAQFKESLTSSDSLQSLGRKLSALSDDPSALLVRLTLDGQVGAPQLMEIEKWIETWDARLQYLDVDRTNLRANVDPADIKAINDSTELSHAALRLDELVASDNANEAAVASTALRQLLVFAHQAEREDAP